MMAGFVLVLFVVVLVAVIIELSKYSGGRKIR
jgi:hypothetical protein